MLQNLKVVYAVHWVQLDSFQTVNQAYQDGKMKLDQLMDRLQAQRYEQEFSGIY